MSALDPAVVSANAGSCSAHRRSTARSMTTSLCPALGDLRQNGSTVTFERTRVRRGFLTAGHPRARLDY
jgi:hypothetical protein